MAEFFIGGGGATCRGLLCWGALAGAVPLAVAQEPFRDVARPLIEAHCFGCHGETAKVGHARLDGAAIGREARRDGRLWQRAIAKVEAGAMPPRSRPPLTDAARAALAEALRATLAAREPDELLDPGVVTLRRLGRFEYDGSVRALFGGAWESGDLFPADPIAHGIDDLGDVMALPPMLFEKYDEASRAIVAERFANAAWRAALLAPALARGGVLDAAAARAIVAPWMERAFRRPVPADELERRVDLFRAQLAAGAPAVEALATTLRSLLVSPDFLFRPESGDPAREEAGVRPLTDFELATRLAYFIWSEPPDAELFEWARAGALREPAALVVQARRLLADPRARTLSDHFAAQWLGFGGIRDVTVDIRRYGRFFGLGLREAYYEQAARFFATIVAEDRSVLDLLDSDWTIADARLADFMGITRPAGSNLEKVALTDRRRGGVLGLGAILTVTSFPLRTSPVLRGKWILEVLLDQAPSPPPANVPALPKDDRQADALTQRQRLELHRADPGCAGCHATMDPLGFALENFDGIGAWRERHEPPAEGTPPAELPPIDACSPLPDGTSIDGPLGLRDWLRAHDVDFLRAFARRLFTFAVGRPVELLDDPEIDAIVAAARTDEARFSRFVEGIVTSRPFRYVRAPR